MKYITLKNTNFHRIALNIFHLCTGANPSSLTEAESQEDETLHRAFLDAFPANEVVLNKYSAMLYISSNGGVTYEEVNEATVCLNCAEKASTKLINCYV